MPPPCAVTVKPDVLHSRTWGGRGMGDSLTGTFHQSQSEQLQRGITSSSPSPPTNDFLSSVWQGGTREGDSLSLFPSWQSPYARVTFVAKAILSHFRPRGRTDGSEAIFTTDHHLARRTQYDDAVRCCRLMSMWLGHVLDFLSSFNDVPEKTLE